MRRLVTDKAFVPALAAMLDIAPGPHATVLAEFEGTDFIGGALYDGFTGAVIHVHLYTNPGRRLSRRFLYCAFDYPFNQLGITKLIGQVPSDNTAAWKLNSHFGFTVEAVIDNYFPTSDLILMSMTRDQCHVLNKWPNRIKETA
jgi:RimJ/RimL family protein N-acetyltransferase